MEEISVKLCNLLDSLPQSRDKLATVDQISVLLSALSPSGLKSVVSNLSFGSLFECLTLCSGPEQLETCCKVLERLLDAVDSSALLSNFHAELLLGLDSECETIRNLCLVQVLRSVENGDQQLIPYIDIIQKVVLLVGCQSLASSKQAVQIIVHIGLTDDGLAFLFGDQILPCFESVLELNDELRFRVYECISGIAVNSVSGLQHTVACGLFQRFIRELDTIDILTRLSCLEILTTVAVTDHGSFYLGETGILQQLDDIITNSDADPFGELLLPGVIKLFGSMSRCQPAHILDTHPQFARFLFNALDGPTTSNMTGIAVETIGFIGSTSVGKLVLGNRAEMPSACRRLGTLLVNAPTQLRERALETVMHLMNLQPVDQTPQLLSLTETWFSQLTRSADESLTTVLNIARQPFMEFRISSLRIVNSLAGLPWGQSRLVAHAGFLEYVLDRSTEHGDRQGLEAKFDVVRTLVGSAMAPNVIPGEFFLRLREYEREGPFYAKHETQVAFESGQ